ncbi:hypothetical protein IID24_00035 [Patescibacteria group bacterium]|nr:hypothetical protein [Patescibacteria group bacterium]
MDLGKLVELILSLILVSITGAYEEAPARHEIPVVVEVTVAVFDETAILARMCNRPPMSPFMAARGQRVAVVGCDSEIETENPDQTLEELVADLPSANAGSTTKVTEDDIRAWCGQSFEREVFCLQVYNAWGTDMSGFCRSPDRNTPLGRQACRDLGF